MWLRLGREQDKGMMEDIINDSLEILRIELDKQLEDLTNTTMEDLEKLVDEICMANDYVARSGKATIVDAMQYMNAIRKHHTELKPLIEKAKVWKNESEI